MTKRIIALLLALILTVGLLPTVALAAEGDETPSTDGSSTTSTDTKTSGVDSEGNTDNPVHIVKSVTTDANGNGTLKLEAYVTDPMTIKTSDVPLDIVLVLDQSGSMGFCVNCGAEFSNGSWQKRKCEYTQYVEVGLAKNLTSSSSSEQLYAFDSWYNSYDPVEYCDGNQQHHRHNAGWYWKDFRHDWDNRIDSESKLYKKVTTRSDNHVHRLDTLTSVLRSFTQSVVDKATGTPNVKHRIAMVGFSSRQWNSGKPFSDGYWEDYKNTEILTGVNSLTNSNDQDKNRNKYYYFPNGYTATNGVQKSAAKNTDYKNALVDVSQSAGQTSVANAITALTACGGTFTDDGLEMAQEIFNANPLTGENAGRKRIVILFTDGAVDSAHRNGAENTAAALKNSGVTVYTIGLFEGANQTTNEGDNDFLQKVSSNDGVAPKQGEKSYYLSATNAASLQKVFEQITEEVNKLMLNVGTETVLSDTLSEYFDFNIPANGDLSNEVTFKLVPVDTKDADGNFTWKEDKAEPLTGSEMPKLTRADGSKSFTVTNFNYGTNKITRVYDETTGQITGYTGNKLVIEIPIKADTNCKSWDATKNPYPTNSSTNGAKLEYKDEMNNPRSTGVDSPEAPVARYSVTYTYGTDSEQPTGVNMPEDTRAYIDGQTIDVKGAPTAPDGYTFDGWYTDEACTPANKVDAKNPPVINKANITLYGKFTRNTVTVKLNDYIEKKLTATTLPANYKEAFTANITCTDFNNTTQRIATANFTSADANTTKGFTEGDASINLTYGQTYSFTVTENEPETEKKTPGLTYDTTAHAFALKVSDTGEVQLGTINTTGEFEAAAANSKVTIENIYTPDEITFSLANKFQKTLNSNVAFDDLPAGANEFTLGIWEGNTAEGTPQYTAAANINKLTASGSTYSETVFFGSVSLPIDAVGTKTYTVKEVVPTIPVAGMKYDTTAYTMTIKVEDVAGKLTVTEATVSDGTNTINLLNTEGVDPLEITNTFTAAELPLDPPTEDPENPTAGFKVIKSLTGDTTTETFSAQLLEGTDVKATAFAAATTGAPAAFKDFGTLVFTEAKTYNYTIKEIPGSTPGMKYDERFPNGHAMNIKVEAEDNKLVVKTVTIDGTEIDLANDAWLTITNEYTTPTATVTKTTLTENAWNSLAFDIKENLETYGQPQFPVEDANNELKLIVDKNVDEVKLAYVVAINGKAGSTVTISDPEADFLPGESTNGVRSSDEDGAGTDKAEVTTANGEWTVEFKADCTVKIFFIKTFHRNKTTDKFDTAVNTVIVNGNDGIPSDPTTITDKDPGSFDFSEIIRKELKLTGSKSFTGAEFEATLKLTGIQHEDEVEINSLTAEYAHVEAWPLNWNYTLVAKFDENAVDGSTTLFLTSNGEHLLLDFPAAGTYTFELQETNKTSTNVTYDDTVYTVVVEVAADNQDSNKLVVTRIDALYTDEDGKVADKVIYISGETKSDVVTFVNTVDTGIDDYPIIIPTIINKDTGMLNKTDHFAYVIGYPDGTVHPNGQITRAEVATIFFRLLRDEVRDGAFTTSNSYSDVAYGKWYNNPISTMSALGIITGYPDGTFKPNKPITRAEFAAIAARFDETQSGKSATFSDVIGHWAAKEIGIAYYNDWIKGYPDGTFKPDQNITRAEAMTLINRVLERKPESPSDLLSDMNVWTDNMDTSKWYYLDVQEATNSHTYTRKTFNYELWRSMLPDPDWSRYER